MRIPGRPYVICHMAPSVDAPTRGACRVGSRRNTNASAPPSAPTHGSSAASRRSRTPGSSIDGEHAVTILAERVPDRYLAFLRSKGVSYLFGGKSRIDLPKVLESLRARFGIRKLLLEGGGKINGSSSPRA
jgi:riboflavin biosynthesis pyrimidine reductase